MQVAAASEEQSATAEEISRNISAINDVTEQSSAGIQQVARAAEDLNRLTENLQNLITKFKLDSNSYDRNNSQLNEQKIEVSNNLAPHEEMEVDW